MKKLKTTENGQYTTVYFHAPSVRDAASAARWVTGAAALSEMDGRYIALRDLSHSADEGRADVQMDPTTELEDILAALEKGGYDRLFLAGTFNGTRVGLGVSLNTFELAVTVPVGSAALTETIAEQIVRHMYNGENEI